MQNLWSRIAQSTCSCRCAACLSQANALTRRGTTSAARATGKPLLRPPTSATFVYTSIFLAATVVDADIKQQRKEKWEALIANVKEKEEELQVAGRQRHPRRSRGKAAREKDEEGLQRQQKAGGKLEEHSANPPTEVGEAASGEEWERALRYEQSTDMEQAQWPASLEPELKVHRLAGNSVYSSSERRHRASRKLLSPKKRRLTELAIRKFVIQVILRYEWHNMTYEQAKSVPEPLRAMVRMHPGSLVSQRARINSEADMTAQLTPHDPLLDIPHPFGNLPNYDQNKSGESIDEINRLNNALRSLVRKRMHRQISQHDFLLNICNNLLISTTLPNIVTFNILVIGLTELRLEPPMEFLIDAARHARVRHNEITCDWILRHYVNHNRPKGFASTIRWMRGGKFKSNYGMMLAHPLSRVPSPEEYSSNPDAGPPTRIKHPFDSNKVIERPYPSQMVLKPVLQGLLKFAGLKHAMDIYADLRAEGWPLSPDMLLLFLRKARDDGDWDSGMTIWTALCQVNAKLFPKSVGRLSRDALHELCYKCGKMELFEQVWQEPIAGTPPGPPRPSGKQIATASQSRVEADVGWERQVASLYTSTG